MHQRTKGGYRSKQNGWDKKKENVKIIIREPLLGATEINSCHT